MTPDEKLAAIRLHAQDAYNRASDAQHEINQHGSTNNDMDTGLYNAVVELANAKLSLEIILEYVNH